jgi:formylglycine-generating enzyme required for sulfatase activity
MKFVPAGTNGVLFSIWDTRVADFQQFVNETGYNATSGMWTLASNGWRQEGNSWSNPGLNQTPDSPVVGVSWNDANQFCLWLTNKERRAGLISAQQSYRLPTDAEWSAAAGNSTYPWGNDWPPPLNAGNYCRLGDGYSASTLSGTDGYACTSPVGSFQSNDYGLYDMGGNVFQYCEDWYHKELNSAEVLSAIPSTANDGGGQAYRVARGASWDHFLPLTLTSSFRVGTSVDYRESCTGFRCVLTKPASSSGTTIAEGVLVLAGLAAAWYYFKGRPKPAATADSTA